MNRFLESLAIDLYNNYPDLGDWQIIVPNKRAGLYLKQYLSKQSTAAFWAPEITDIQSWVAQETPEVAADNLSLIFHLYEATTEVMKRQNINWDMDFDRFHFWGDLLVKDFEDVDKNLSDARVVFKQVQDLKEIEQRFDPLSDDEFRLFRGFWESFFDSGSQRKERFLVWWNQMGLIYENFQSRLKAEKLTYPGRMFRQLAEAPELNAFHKKMIFAGFNILSKSEIILLSRLLESGQAEIRWEVDEYYLADIHQEAGRYFREYLKHPQLKKGFPTKIPNRISAHLPETRVIGAPGVLGQTQSLREILEKLPTEELSDTAVVICDQNMLFPLLDSLPENISELNVTMGYPLRHTPLYAFCNQLLDLQLTAKEKENRFYHEPCLRLLRNPYLGAFARDEAATLAEEIESKNQIFPSMEDIENELLKKIFKKQTSNHSLLEYLQEILLYLHEQQHQRDDERSKIDAEYLFAFIRHLNRIKDLLAGWHEKLSTEQLIRIFKELAASMRIPFSGEPLNGLQIMGPLETRSLNFKNVIYLGFNEDAYPGLKPSQSFIPYHIRKAFGMPTFEHNESLYAYYFYRQLHSAETLYLIYNNVSSETVRAEQSRYILQLEAEHPQAKDKIKHEVKLFEGMPKVAEEIKVKKSEAVKVALEEYRQRISADNKGISATALTDFMECKLRFYLKEVMQITGSEEVGEEVDAAQLGRILHNALENLYKPFQKKEVSRANIEAMINQLPTEIEKLYKEELGSDVDTSFGRNLLAKEIITDFAKQILSRDKDSTPFTFLRAEERLLISHMTAEGKKVQFKGFVDRQDEIMKDGQSIHRVIDYKTGKADPKFGSLNDLFRVGDDYEVKRFKKLPFQTFFYAYLLKQKYPQLTSLLPGVASMRNMATPKGDYQYMNSAKTDVIYDDDLHLGFSEKVDALISDIFDNDDLVFSQTEDEAYCSYCPFKAYCRK
ncbi:MAG: PD-(D/E)XK nuclease family protein [Cyclobacteriaceae bacterium]|nr:PD-(D/E)XK nuclease family protein [Cyclobacteriaceae bacterium]MCH8515989.1 PD-(D/E)XK nuclease family protein [Cyclobacteriaceae bacterium]